MRTQVDDVIRLFRPLSLEEAERAEALIPVVEDLLFQEAKNVDLDLNQMIISGEVSELVFKSVVVDVVSRTLLTSTTSEPMSQMSESAMGYSVSGTFLNPGGGIFIKQAELARLGLMRQTIGVINLCPCYTE